MRASFDRMSWNFAIGWPKASRCFAYSSAAS